MKPSTLLALSLLASLTACGSSSAPAEASKVASEPDAGATTITDASAATGDAPMPSGSSNATDSSVPVEAAGPVATVVMPHISAGVPAFASSSQSSAKSSDDDEMTSNWSPTGLPAWIAYDVSAAPATERQSALFVWNAEHAGGYLNTAPIASGNSMPTDYTIEINAAPGGSASAPTTGWMQVASISNNLRNTVETPFDLNGGNWVRMSIAGSSDPSVAIDVDVFSTPNGATDAWMLMGDSITFITMDYGFSDVPQLVHAMKADRWPAVINAAVGGTSTVTAVSVIDDTMAGFPGRFVALAYGTNDQPGQFEMETLIQHVLAAGKIPVVPHMPWSALSNIQTNGPLINQQIDALYAKYPQVVRGPDLWAAFLNRTDLIPATDVHPNSAGQEVLRQQWAQTMASIP